MKLSYKSFLNTAADISISTMKVPFEYYLINHRKSSLSRLQKSCSERNRVNSKNNTSDICTGHSIRKLLSKSCIAT